MAVFSNQATLTYNGNSTSSNIAYGEILDVIAVSKTVIGSGYGAGERLTYVVTLRNTGSTALTGLRISDDLGGYSFGTGTRYPLTYVAGSAALFVNGVEQAAPTVTAGPPMEVGGIGIPAGGDAVLVYQADVTDYANPGAEGTIVNTVTITGTGITTPVSASETVSAIAAANLSISKSISPAQVVENDRVTYTLVIQNSGSVAVTATDAASVSDTFDPILSALNVTFDGAAWTQGTQFTYNAATGLFATTPGQITVPAATYTQDATTGAYTVTPGTATLIITGTI